MKESQASQDSSVTFSARRGPRWSAAAVGQNLEPVPSPGLPKRLAVRLGCLGLAGLLLTACGGGRATSTGSTLGPRPTLSSTSTSTSTTDPAGLAVLAAYRAGWAAFEQALATANPADPALAATMIDPQLQGVKANLLADQVHGMIGRGTFTLHPKIVSLSASTATVVDCAYSTSVLLYAKTGKPVPPITPPENDGVRAALVFTGGTWKVYKQTVTDGKCAPGS
jgi:hypothetical protein